MSSIVAAMASAPAAASCSRVALPQRTPQVRTPAARPIATSTGMSPTTSAADGGTSSRVAADHRVERAGEAHVAKHRGERERGARRGDGEERAAPPELVQQLHRAGKGLRGHRPLALVEEPAVGGDAAVQRFVRDARKEPREPVLEPQPDRRRAGGLVRLRQAELPHRLAHRQDDVEARVGEGAVEVEDGEAHAGKSTTSPRQTKAGRGEVRTPPRAGVRRDSVPSRPHSSGKNLR